MVRPRTERNGVLALDLGTSSIRAVVYDTHGRMLRRTLVTIPYTVDIRLPGQVSSSAETLVGLAASAIDRALRAAQQEQLHIDAVAVSCYWHSLVGVGRQGRPTTEILTWADTRSAEEASRLRTEADERAYHSRTGCFFHASFWPAKLRWLRSSRP